MSLETVFQDLRYAARMLSRNAGFTSVALLALALGIGANTVVFTAYKSMIDRPIDARDAREIVHLGLIRSSGAADSGFSYPDYLAYRDSIRSFRGVIAYSPERLTLSAAGAKVGQSSSAAGSMVESSGLLAPGASNTEFASVFAVSENYFEVLGRPVIRGHGFESLGTRELVSSPAVLISENYWQKRFEGDPAILGKTIRLNGAAVQIVGITPHDFVGTSIAVPDFWLPLSLEPLVHADSNWLENRENRPFALFARLAHRATINAAQAEMDIVANHLRALHDPNSESAKPVTALIWPATPFPLPLRFYRGLETTILLIMLAAAMLLVVACANVGSLQLARARSRQNELRTRLSLGASRLRVIRQLLTESALLGLVAGIVALSVSWGFMRVLVVFLAQTVPPEDGTLVYNVNPNLAIFSYVLAVSLVAGILFGIAPALESSRSALSSSARFTTSPAATRRLQDVLIAAQVCLSLVLLIAGGILIHSSINTLNMAPGYDRLHVIDLQVQFPEGSKYTPPRQVTLIRELRSRLEDTPGIVATSSALPPNDRRFRTAVIPLGQSNAPVKNTQLILYYSYVDSNYFRALGIPVILGHGFHRQQPQYSIVLSESAAERLLPGQNPIGRSIRLGATDELKLAESELVASGPAYQVIGIAANTRGVEFNGSNTNEIYLPLPDERLQNYPILIRTQTNPAQIVGVVGHVIASVDPDLIATCSTLQERLRGSAPVLASALAAAIASSIGVLGLLLALMGIYGTVSYIVVLRTREVGIRMAIGAQKRDVLKLILRESARPVFTGMMVGMLGAVGAAYLLRGVLYGVSRVDAVSFLGVSLLFVAVALFAAYPPSRRAMRIDPGMALRYE